MVLNDLKEEYELIFDYIHIANNFYSDSTLLVQFYTNQLSISAQNYYSRPSQQEQFTSDLNHLYREIYHETLKLNSKITALNKSVIKLESLSLKNKMLKADVKNYIEFSNDLIETIHAIVEYQFKESIRKGYFCRLFTHLRLYVAHYSMLLTLQIHIANCSNILYEPLPQHIQNNEKYSEFCIQSLTAPKDFDTISQSIASFGQMFDGALRLLELPTSDNYYIRKVETGSLIIVVTSSTISIVAFIKFIDFCIKKYIDYRKAGLDIQSMRQQIIKTDLELAEKALNLSPNLENKNELLEKAVTNAFSYFKFNPKFKIGQKIYDTGEATALITNTSTTNTSNKDTK